MSEKEKLNILVDSEIARAIKIESARLRISQGELISQMWSAYKAKNDRGEVQDQAQEIEKIPIAKIEDMQARKAQAQAQDLRELRIRKAKEILEDWARFDVEIIERYRDRMREIGEEKLAKELEDLADYKRRVI